MARGESSQMSPWIQLCLKAAKRFKAAHVSKFPGFIVIVVNLVFCASFPVQVTAKECPCGYHAHFPSPSPHSHVLPYPGAA